jgi:thiamine biosynthesis lipoprotein ApbE
MQLPGGVAQRYAVDKMVEVLRAGGITSAPVFLGAEIFLNNNSISTSGNHKDKADAACAWRL